MSIERYHVRGRTLAPCMAILCMAISGCASLDAGESAAAHSGEASAGPRTVAVGASIPRPDPAAWATTSAPETRPVRADGDPTGAGGDTGLWAQLRAQFEVRPVERHRIETAIERYAGRQEYFDIVLERGEPYLLYILSRIEARGLPGELLLMPMVESTFRPFAYSRSRAAGIWQFMPATGRYYGLEQTWWFDARRDVIASTEAALDYLEHLHGLFDGDWLLAVAAYNGGQGRVRDAMQANAARGAPTDFWHLDLPPQTEAYVPRVLALKAILAAPAEYGIELPELASDAALTIVEVAGQIDLALAAEMAGIPVEKLYRYNPGFNRWATPPDGPHRLALPAARAEAFRAALAARDDSALVRWRRHRIEPGDTLIEIADNYDTTVTALQDLNGLHGSFLRAGDHLLVPTASRPAPAYALSKANRRRARQSRGPAGRQRMEYRVRSGDTLWELSRRYDVAVGKLAAWNDMVAADPLRAGQRLVIWVEPGSGIGGSLRAGPSHPVQRVRYTVRTGDSLYEIARQFGLSVAEIERWNALDGQQYLHPGQELLLRVDVTDLAEAG